jgi:hypothetical protein
MIRPPAVAKAYFFNFLGIALVANKTIASETMTMTAAITINSTIGSNNSHLGLFQNGTKKAMTPINFRLLSSGNHTIRSLRITYRRR